MTQNQQVNHEAVSQTVPSSTSVEPGTDFLTNKHAEGEIMNQQYQLDPVATQMLKDKGMLPPDFENEIQVEKDFFKDENSINKTQEENKMVKQITKQDEGNMKPEVIITENLEMGIQTARNWLKTEVLETPYKHFNTEFHHKLNNLMVQVKEDPKSVITNSETFAVIIDGTLKQLQFGANLFSGVTAVYAIKVGQIMNSIEEVFINENLGGKRGFHDFVKGKGLVLRTMQKYMKLAKHDDVEDYADLGIDRISIMVSSIDRSDYNGNISDFIEKYKIDINPLLDYKKSVNDFKIDISKGILKHLNEQEDWGVTDDILENFAKRKKGSIDYAKLSAEIEIVIESDGKAKLVFDKYLNGGKNSRQINKLVKDVTKDMGNLQSKITEIRANQKAFEKIGSSKIDALMEELQMLKEGVKASLESA